jgi:hypothetical protein
MSWFAVGAAVVTAISAYSSSQQQAAAQESAANMDRYNAEIAANKAEQSNAAATLQINDQRRKARAQIGRQLASSAEAGAGLNEDLLRQSIYDSEQDTAAIRYSGNLQATGYSNDAAASLSNAAYRDSTVGGIKAGGYLNAIGAIANTGAKYYGRKQ